MEPTTHELKTIQPYFDDICSGKKTFEIRRFDRDYKIGDKLHLAEWDLKGHYFTGKYRIRVISHILTDAQQYGLMDGYCILSFEI